MRKQVRFVSLSIACALVAAFATAQATQSAQVPFSLAVSTSTPTIKMGSELKLDVAVTNTSDKRVSLWSHPGKLAPGLDVRNSKGKPANEVKAKSEPPKGGVVYPPGGSYPSLDIDPGKTVHFEEIVTRKFDLTKPGTYTVQAMQEFDNKLLKSNTITITVTP